MKQWKAHYRDAHHDLDILIHNEESDKFDNLTFSIDGFTFIGGDLSSFELKDAAQYDLAKERFSLMKWGGDISAIGHSMPYRYDLQRYSLSVQIPIRTVRTADASITEGILYVGYRYVPHDPNTIQSRIYCDDQRVYRDDLEVTEFRFVVDDETFSVPCDSLWFEPNLLALCRMLGPRYQLRCCYTCQWSDYSPYGSDDFGTMLCYRAHKAEYLKVNDKDDYFEHLESLPCEQRQETYLCPDFTPRSRCEGYRGYLE